MSKRKQWPDRAIEFMQMVNARKIAVFLDETEEALVLTNTKWEPDVKKKKGARQ